MTNDNIFSGLKVVDLSSFIAGPSAAVILSDYGADVIKVEPPTGDPFRNIYRLPPQPRSRDNYPWHLDNRNKRGMTLDLKSPLLAAAGKGAISADRRGPRRQCSVAATGHRLRWNWFQKEKILTDRQ